MSIDLLGDGNKSVDIKWFSLKCPKCGKVYRKVSSDGSLLEHIECCAFGVRMKKDAQAYAEFYRGRGVASSLPPSKTVHTSLSPSPHSDVKKDLKTKPKTYEVCVLCGISCEDVDSKTGKCKTCLKDESENLL